MLRSAEYCIVFAVTNPSLASARKGGISARRTLFEKLNLAVFSGELHTAFSNRARR